MAAHPPARLNREAAVMFWEIKPFVGLGSVLFGMTDAEVAALGPTPGPLLNRWVEDDGTVIEYREMDEPTISYCNGRVCFIAAVPKVENVIWQGINVFQLEPKTLLQLLEMANGGARVGLGFVLFENLGLRADGFYFHKERQFFRLNSDDQDDRCIALFDHELWHSLAEQPKSRYEPITFIKK
jgi:hypothetical protein